MIHQRISENDKFCATFITSWILIGTVLSVRRRNPLKPAKKKRNTHIKPDNRQQMKYRMKLNSFLKILAIIFLNLNNFKTFIVSNI